MEHRLGEKASGPCICICCGDNCDKQHSDTLHLHTLIADNTEAVFCVDCVTSIWNLQLSYLYNKSEYYSICAR